MNKNLSTIEEAVKRVVPEIGETVYETCRCDECPYTHDVPATTRTIQLQDVLRAIGNMLVVVDCWGNFYQLEMKMSDKLPKFSKDKPTARYDLTRSFYDQSDELYEFVAQLLATKD